MFLQILKNVQNDLVNYRGDSLTHLMLIIGFSHFRPEGHRKPRNEVGSLTPAERLVGFEPEPSNSDCTP